MDSLYLKLGDLSVRAARQVCTCRGFSSSTARFASKKTPLPRKYRDPYTLAQAKARREANISRRAQLLKARQDALGDPVRGKSTPFVEAMDTASPPPVSAVRSSSIPWKTGSPDKKLLNDIAATELNYGLSPSELQKSLDRSLVWSGRNMELNGQGLMERWSAGDDINSIGRDLLNPDPDKPSHITASKAIARIASLAGSSSKDRLKVNVKRCISTFGRHMTDQHLPAKPAPSPRYLARLGQKSKARKATPTPRGGPDTGSSEVQIAVLTARIRTLSQFLGTRGKVDKVNKRNLRLLVHKRQKLLKYLERKERGGPRFRNVVDVLGLEEGAWKGEISL